MKTFSKKRQHSSRKAVHGQTLSHLRYICRDSAARTILRTRVAATDASQAKLSEYAAEKRSGRVAERFIIALPLEATPRQREILAREFSERLTHRKAGYIVAIHDKCGNDVANPHMHIVAFDDFEKKPGRGRPRSVIGMARKGAVQRYAGEWTSTHNNLMERWGYPKSSMITHLSFEAQGIERIPTIHEGSAVRIMADKGTPPQPNRDWYNVDHGHTRREANRIIKQINQINGGYADERGLCRLGNTNQRDRPQIPKILSQQRESNRRDSRSLREPEDLAFEIDQPRKVPGTTSRNSRTTVHDDVNDYKSKINCPPWAFSRTSQIAKEYFSLHFRRKRTLRRTWRDLIRLRSIISMSKKTKRQPPHLNKREEPKPKHEKKPIDQSSRVAKENYNLNRDSC